MTNVGVFGEGGVALRWGGSGGGVVRDEKGSAGMGEGVVDLEASMGEADTRLLYGGLPSHRSRVVLRGEPSSFVYLVQ